MSASALLLLAAAGPETVGASSIGWEKRGAFQTCLEAQAKEWIETKMELVVNENPAASKIDDMTVALWTMQAIKDCDKADGGDPASELLFVSYMTRWREHIDAAAEVVRRKQRPD